MARYQDSRMPAESLPQRNQQDIFQEELVIFHSPVWNGNWIRHLFLPSSQLFYFNKSQSKDSTSRPLQWTFVLLYYSAAVVANPWGRKVKKGLILNILKYWSNVKNTKDGYYVIWIKITSVGVSKEGLIHGWVVNCCLSLAVTTTIFFRLFFVHHENGCFYSDFKWSPPAPEAFFFFLLFFFFLELLLLCQLSSSDCFCSDSCFGGSSCSVASVACDACD